MFELIKYKMNRKMDKERIEQGMCDFEKAYFDKNDMPDALLKKYLAFSVFIQSCFISEKGYIIDTGNFETANLELIDRIKDKIEKHPLLWKLFFMVA